MKRFVLVVSVSAALGLMLAAPAFAQYPSSPTAAACGSTTIPQGGNLCVAGNNWQPGSTETISLFSTPVVLGTATADANGQFSVDVTIPSGTAPGSHTVEVSGIGADGQPATASFGITVTGAGAPPGGVAFTGSNISVGVALLVVFGLIGLVFFLAGRKEKVEA